MPASSESEPIVAKLFVTPASWATAQVAHDHLSPLLLEQAHLEKKAAAIAVQFLFRLPLDARLHRQLSALAREELLHFERALKLLGQRGIAFAPQESSGYAEQLKKAVRRDFVGRQLDELLVAALIEHRSHERMSQLAGAFAETAPDASGFYADLCPSEERHEQLYLDLALLVADQHAVQARYQELADREAKVLTEQPFAARLHSGLVFASQDGDGR